MKKKPDAQCAKCSGSMRDKACTNEKEKERKECKRMSYSVEKDAPFQGSKRVWHKGYP